MSTKSNNPSPIVKLAGVGILFIGFFYLNVGLQKASQYINELPVQGKAAETAPAPQDAQAAGPVSRSMHPLLVESNQKAALLRREGPQGEASNLDALFGRDAAQKEIDEKKRKEAEIEKAMKSPPPTPASSSSSAPAPAVAAMPVFDYFRGLAQRVRVQAVMADGAVVNGGFYEVGADVKSLGYPSADGKKTLYPVLESVEAETVYLAEPDSKRKIKARLGK